MNCTTFPRRVRFSTAAGSAAILALLLSVEPASTAAQVALEEGRALRIGLIGAGRMGAPLGQIWAEVGHTVVYSSRNPAELMDLVKSAAPRAVAGYPDAAAYFGEVIILAVPPSAIPQLGEDYGDLMRGKIVVDISNPRVDRDGEITNEWLERGTGEAMAEYLPGTRFVKALNTVNPRHFETPIVDGQRVGVPIAGNDREAMEVVAQLVRDLGLDPVIVGPLSRAKEFDRGTSIWETGASAAEIRKALSLP